MSSSEEGQQHPLNIYFWIWGLLFVVSGFSYMVDYLNFQGYTRWTLIIVFMFVKAGFIVGIFMHMTWERLALKLAILLPPIAILIFIGMMTLEADYTFLTRIEFFGESTFVPEALPHH
jgi:cytochrome c oxidase subunit 4